MHVYYGHYAKCFKADHRIIPSFIISPRLLIPAIILGKLTINYGDKERFMVTGIQVKIENLTEWVTNWRYLATNTIRINSKYPYIIRLARLEISTTCLKQKK